MEKHLHTELFFKATDDHRVIEWESDDPGAIEKLSKYLLLRNHSLFFRRKQLKESLIFWNRLIVKNNIDKNSEHSYVKKAKAAKEELEKIEKSAEINLLDEIDGRCFSPAGFWYLGKSLDDSHLNKEVTNIYTFETSRDYQVEATNKLLKYNRATCVAATGLGKSLIISNICKTFTAAGKRVLVVAPTEDLGRQLKKSIEGFFGDLSVGFASSKSKPKLGCDVLVVTVMSALKHCDIFDVILCDEGHHLGMQTWFDIFEVAENAKYVYSFTATPTRTDGLERAIYAFAGPVVFEKDAAWAIKNGWISEFDTVSVFYQPRDNKGKKMSVSSKAQRTTAYKKLVCDGDFLNKISDLVIEAAAKKRKIICLVRTLKAGHALKKAIGNRAKAYVASADFKFPLDKFKKGELDILIATDRLVGEGIDIPFADTLFMITQHSSPIITYQAIGRILRKHKDKKKPMVLDCCAKGYEGFDKSYEKRLKVIQNLADKMYSKQID